MIMFQDKLPLSEKIFHGTRFQFLVLSRSEVKSFTAETPYLIISVTDPEKPAAEIAESPFLMATLRLKFHDIGKPSRIADQFANHSTDILMSEKDAKEILCFVAEYLTKTTLIVCHCEQGVSRSAAIAAALSRILQNEDDFFWQNYWANRWVHDLLSANADILRNRL